MRWLRHKSDLENELHAIELNSRGDLYKGEKLLYHIWQANRTNLELINQDLFRLLRYNDIWIGSYIKLFGSNRFKIPNPNSWTITDESFNLVMAVKASVLNQTFKWGHLVKVQQSAFESAIGMLNWRDRLVQEVVCRVLNSIYEPLMLPCSHGFRPGRNCHTALRYIRTNFKDIKWVIGGSISNLFKNLNLNFLKKILKKKICDERFLNLVYSGCQSKIRLLVNSWKKLDWNLRDDMFLLIANIYLHEFDTWIVKRINTTICRSQEKHLFPNNIHFDIKKSSYVRYAANFMIGLSSSYIEASRVKEVVEQCLSAKLNLILNQSSFKISDFTTQGISFLGYWIKNDWIRYTKLPVNKFCLAEKSSIILKSNNSFILQWLSKKGFCKKDGYPIPNFTYLHNTQAVTNAKINDLLTSFNNYYSLADDRKYCISFIFRLLSFSVAKMYAAKYRWHRITTIFKLGGKDLARLIKLKTKFIDQIDGSGNSLNGLLFAKFQEIPAGDKQRLHPKFSVSWPIIYTFSYSSEMGSIEKLFVKHAVISLMTDSTLMDKYNF